MKNIIEQLKADISILKTENDKKITTLAKLHLRKLDDLKIENESLRHELNSKNKFHCNHCELKSLSFHSPRGHKNRNHEGQYGLREENVMQVITRKTFLKNIWKTALTQIVT